MILKKHIRILLLFAFIVIFKFASCQNYKPNDAIYSGIPWFDNDGNIVSAHGAGITVDNGRYYLFGEYKSDISNVFNGFSCYSSDDLYNWTFEKIVLPIQPSGKLGPNRVGERPKVLKCPKTGEYIMYMHVDSINYNDQYVGYASSKTINGTYTFHGALLFNGKPIKKWDMGVFQDTDGSGYVITHSGNLYKLSDDYKSVSQQLVKDMTPHCEAPAIIKKDSIYFWLGSGLTSWERNDNYYFTAKSLSGPWTDRGIFAPEGSLTWNSQTTSILSIAGSIDTTFLFMGDRWAFPRQQSAATYVWQPLIVSGNNLSIPDYKESWQLNSTTGTWSNVALEGRVIENTDSIQIVYSGEWSHSMAADQFSDSRSDVDGASFSVSFTGTQIGIYGVATPDGGYAKVVLQNNNGITLLSTTIEMYCKYPESSLKFLSPVLKTGSYTLIVTVLGEHGNWYNKKGTSFGSTGNFISVDKVLIHE